MLKKLLFFDVLLAVSSSLTDPSEKETSEVLYFEKNAYFGVEISGKQETQREREQNKPGTKL